MVDYPVVVEFARDVVDDERHGELEDYVLASVIDLSVMGTYLNHDANQYESLIFTLGADTLPPNLEAKSPIFRTTESLSFGKYRLEKLILRDQRSLPATDNEQLLIVSLVQPDPNRQVQAHAPVLHLAGESSVHGIYNEDREREDMHREQGQEHEWNIPHSEDGMLPGSPGEETC